MKKFLLKIVAAFFGLIFVVTFFRVNEKIRERQVQEEQRTTAISNAAWDLAIKSSSSYEATPPEQPRTISFTNAPLKAVLVSLAKQGKINYVVHTSASHTFVRSNKTYTPVTIHWEAISPAQAFENVLSNHHLFMEKNPKYNMGMIFPRSLPSRR